MILFIHDTRADGYIRVLFYCLAVCFGLWSGAGCSLSYNWDPQDGQFCEGVSCADGFSCLGERCVRDGSLSLGESCIADQQCQALLVCAGFVCRQTCSSFLSADGCGSTEICQSAYRSESSVDDAVSVCMSASGCQTDLDCSEATANSAGTICVNLDATSSDGVCLDSCGLSVDGGVSSSCLEGRSGTCAMLGTAPKPVCIAISDQSQGLRGDTCALPDSPCDLSRGLTCHDGECREFCDLDGDGSECESSESCTSFGPTEAGYQNIGYCCADC